MSDELKLLTLGFIPCASTDFKIVPLHTMELFIPDINWGHRIHDDHTEPVDFELYYQRLRQRAIDTIKQDLLAAMDSEHCDSELCEVKAIYYSHAQILYP